MRISIAAVLAACSSSVATTAPPPVARVADAGVSDAAAPVAKRWLVGDVHVHVAPPDTDQEVDATLDKIVAASKQLGLDFVILTPHMRPAGWSNDRAGKQTAWRTLAASARDVKSPTLIPGVEWTTRRGHFGVFGVDIGALRGDDFLAAAHDAGAVISVNHPFAVPTHLSGVEISDYDLSYRVWTEGATGFTAIDGAEVWNVPLSMANLVSRPGGRTGEERAWTELDRVAHAEHRRVIALGGSDDHHAHVVATTWVLAADASEASILAAIRAGATCVGGPEGGSLRARADGGEWVTIGGAVRGKQVTLAWDGTARLFVDDKDQGEHDGGFVHDTGGASHTYRIVAGRSRCGFVYAN